MFFENHIRDLRESCRRARGDALEKLAKLYARQSNAKALPPRPLSAAPPPLQLLHSHLHCMAAARSSSSASASALTAANLADVPASLPNIPSLGASSSSPSSIRSAGVATSSGRIFSRHW